MIGLLIFVALGLPAALIGWGDLFGGEDDDFTATTTTTPAPTTTSVVQPGVTMSVRVYPNDRWVVPRPIEDIPRPPPVDIEREPCNTAERARWVEQLGGVATSWDQDVEVIITSTFDIDVVIEGFELKTIERTDPLQGTNIRFCGGGGPLNANLLELDLDANPPTFLFRPEIGEPTDRFVFVLSPQNERTAYFLITPSASAYRVEWSGELVYRVNGELRRSVIDNNGKAFTVTPNTPGPVYAPTGDDNGPPWIMTE